MELKGQMYLKKQIENYSIHSLKNIYNVDIDPKEFIVNLTKPDFDGDYTIVLFGLSKVLQINIQQLGNELGQYLVQHFSTTFSKYTLTQGFLNLTINDTYLTAFLNKEYLNKKWGKKPFSGEKIIVEYSSPNTNKPLHLGHLRNNFLGFSISKIYEWNGYDVFTTCIVNDRGVHICKSMLAWQLWGNGATPQSTNKKGDHFVGDYYVLFSNALKKEVEELKQKGIIEEEAEKQTSLMKAVQEMLVLWEKNDDEVKLLWKKMNEWVYEGFEETYKKIGSKFNKTYFESDTYLLGKKFVEQGLEEKIFFKKEDGSIWIDLEEYGLDKKLLLRKDGTSVYITQDLGLAEYKYNDFPYQQSIYVVGDEQNHHFQVLKRVLQKIKKNYANGIFHLSYGMVELPSGKMKSREGTVVDADDLIFEMKNIAHQHTIELGKVEGFTEQELIELSETIGMAALKFYLLKVDPKKKMVFNPEESIDFQGFTGPFIQYTYARINSIFSKITFQEKNVQSLEPFEQLERDLILECELFATTIEQSWIENNPSLIAIYAYQLAKKFNSFYAAFSILKTNNKDIQYRRLQITLFVKNILENCAEILGFQLPKRM